MRLPDLVPSVPRFRTHADVLDALREACTQHDDVARVHELGTSEEGRPLVGLTLGRGPQHVSLVAGAHADEPVGPETLRTFVLDGLAARDELDELFRRYTFAVIPHLNPDGEARNRAWIERWPDLHAYLARRVRELPGRDVEFGFPARRSETAAAAQFLAAHGPFRLHLSLHGMGFSEGAMLLIDRRWGFRTEGLQQAFRETAAAAGLALHDHNRQGEKGFFYLGPGFTTTPEGAAMQAFFLSQGAPATASQFGMSSMDYVRSLGGDPLCLVTELPLFVVRKDPHAPAGEPTAYLQFKDALAPLQRAQSDDADALREQYGLEAVPLRVAMKMQLAVIEQGLEAIPEPLPA